MDTSSFINALRHIFALRGPIWQIHSDCGTNFKGGYKELKLLIDKTNDFSISRYLIDEGCTWVFNLPHSSHLGGVWERMKGVSRQDFGSHAGTNQFFQSHSLSFVNLYGRDDWYYQLKPTDTRFNWSKCSPPFEMSDDPDSEDLHTFAVEKGSASQKWWYVCPCKSLFVGLSLQESLVVL